MISLVTHGVKKQWLKSEARRRRSRRRSPPWTGRGNRGRGALPRHVPREPPHPPRETRETLNLGQCAADKQQHRREREEAKAKTDRTGPKAVAKKMPKPVAASSSSKEPASTVTQTALGDDGEPVPLTMEDAVQLWLLWLGVTDIDQEPEPNRLLPYHVEDVIRDSFLMYPARDQLTLMLGFTSLVQSLMATVGSLLETACARVVEEQEAGRNADRDPEPEEESDDNLLMQTGITQPHAGDWHLLLDGLQRAFGEMNKVALACNVRWLQRRLHHRCVNMATGQLLGLRRGLPGDLVALLAAMGAEAEGVETCSAAACDAWCHEWWNRLLPFLPMCDGSLAWSGSPVPDSDPMPVLFMKPMPGSDDESDAETAPWEPPRGPPPPPPTRMHSPSPTDSELGAVAAQLEEEEHLRADRGLQEAAHGRDEEVQNDYYQQLHEEHLAWRARSWDDWAMRDEMQHPKRQRTCLRLTLGSTATGATLGSMDIPLETLHGGQVTLGMRLHTSVEEPEKVDAAQGSGSGLEPSQPLQPHEILGGAGGSDWDNMVGWQGCTMIGGLEGSVRHRSRETGVHQSWRPCTCNTLST